MSQRCQGSPIMNSFILPLCSCLRANTDGSVRESLQLLKNDRFKKNYLPSEILVIERLLGLFKGFLKQNTEFVHSR